MKACGMKYCYTYEEQWQPKDFPVFFRMYQLNFDGNEGFVYKKYWNMCENHFIEEFQYAERLKTDMSKNYYGSLCTEMYEILRYETSC